MPKNRPVDLVVLGEDWGAHPSSTQHIIRNLSADRRVLWANSIGMRRPRLTAHDGLRVVRKVAAAAGLRPRPSLLLAVPVPPPPFPVVQPIVLPMATSRMGRALNRAMMRHILGGASRAAGLDRPVLWLSMPSGLDAIGSVGEKAVVYYCCDDFGSLAGVDHAIALEFEAELAERADLVIVSSPELARRFPQGKTHLLPHGVDNGLFSTPVARAMDMPPGPVAGFYGAIAPWIDLDLVAQAARAVPTMSFVMVGPVQCDISPLHGLDNVHLLGARPHATLPSYAQHWDVGMIPFRDTPQITACNPLKLREYLAAGRPIVATPFPALQPYLGLVDVAPDGRSFVAAIENAAAGLSLSGAAARQAAVAGEGWDARAAEAARLIALVSA